MYGLGVMYAGDDGGYDDDGYDGQSVCVDVDVDGVYVDDDVCDSYACVSLGLVMLC